MRAEHDALWSAIQEFAIDETGVTVTFAQKLARQQGWTEAFALRAIEEYRRFVYLAMTGEREATPSEDVDQVWHLHLQYTVSYWERMHAFLPRKLHHHPSRGGSAEDGRIDRQYRQTLALYEEAFGEPAPDDLWPRATDRARHRSTVSDQISQDTWSVPKKQARWAGGLAAVGVLATLGAGCAPLLAQDATTGLGIALVGAGAVVVVILVIAAFVRKGGQPGQRRSGNGISGGSHFVDHGSYGPSGHAVHSDGGHHAAGDGGDPGSLGGDASTDGTMDGQSAVSESSSTDSGPSSDSGGSSGGDSSSGCGGGGCGGGGGD
ncbi:MAG: hypothetical protein JST30_05045 [Armatimonadetes bacterium]|nr:hypothetical protein [Armatimonadota bacterium]